MSSLSATPRYSAPGDLQRRIALAMPSATEAERRLLRSAAKRQWWSECLPAEQAAIFSAERRGPSA